MEKIWEAVVALLIAGALLAGIFLMPHQQTSEGVGALQNETIQTEANTSQNETTTLRDPLAPYNVTDPQNPCHIFIHTFENVTCPDERPAVWDGIPCVEYVKNFTTDEWTC